MGVITKNDKLSLVVAVICAGLAGAVITGNSFSQHAAVAQGTDLQPRDTNFTGLPRSTISTTGTASEYVRPDKVSVNVGVETNGTTASDAVSANSAAIERIITALRNIGIAESELATSSFSVYPIYAHSPPMQPCIEIYPPPPECLAMQTIVGYGASNSITITLDVNASSVEAGQAIDAAVEAGANNVNAAYFFISPELQERTRNMLFSEALDDARQRAELAADAVGYNISGVYSITLGDVYFPIYFGKTATEGDFATAQTTLLPGEQQVTASANVVYTMNEKAAST